MTLHNEIMNIQVDPTKMRRIVFACKNDAQTDLGKALEMAYKLGHRDARHDAAELSLKGDNDGK